MCICQRRRNIGIKRYGYIFITLNVMLCLGLSSLNVKRGSTVLFNIYITLPNSVGHTRISIL